jgi:hypothetical protein
VALVPQILNLKVVKKSPSLHEEGDRQWLRQAASASRCGSALGTRLAILSVSPAITEFIGTSKSPRRRRLIHDSFRASKRTITGGSYGAPSAR